MIGNCEFIAVDTSKVLSMRIGDPSNSTEYGGDYTDVVVSDGTTGGAGVYFFNSPMDVKMMDSRLFVENAGLNRYGYSLLASTTGYLRMACSQYDSATDSDGTAGHVYMTNCFDGDCAPIANMAP